MSPLVSVIVPVYNTQDYLDRCVESILRQTYENMDIILVNDGSTDDSLKICEKYREKDSRIQVISQINQGIIAAKRAGIMQALGEYVMFVDSDDWIEPEMLQGMMVKMTEGICSLVCANVYMDMPDGTIEKRNAIPAEMYETGKIARDLFFYKDTDKYGILPYSVAKLYTRKMLENVLQRVSGDIKYAEDKAIVFSCVYQNIRVYFSDDIYYHYCIRKGSICQSENEDYLVELTSFYKYAKGLFELHREREYLLHQLGKYLWMETSYAINYKLGLVVTPEKSIGSTSYQLDPSTLLSQQKNLILYGAGNVGADYHRQLSDCMNIQLCAWVDKNYKKYQANGLDVQPIECIPETEYDIILVAVKKQSIFQEIKSELMSMGIAEETILWGRPYGAPFECGM